ncbi:MAG: hypothetical protein UMV23_02810 [Halanaerobium sp.]|nr:hypothetical protein [Halanaerobium sp.]
MKNIIDLYQMVYILTKEQKDAIDDGDYDRVLAVLEKKAKLMATLDSVNIEEYIRGQEEQEASYQKLQRLLQKIKGLEEENVSLLEKKIETTNRELKNIKRLKKDGVYKPQSKGKEARYINKKV